MSQSVTYRFSLQIITVCHILLIASSNLLVQYPFQLFGLHTTWGAFTYPMIFILTDLSTRLVNAEYARQIVFRSMIPALLISYLTASLLDSPERGNLSGLLEIHTMPMRIALACFVAYVTGQLLDIYMFQQLRNKISNWWCAPLLSSAIGNLMDTSLFFAIAFYHCDNAFLNQHWPEIALVDLAFKIAISLLAFIPLYGLVLRAVAMNFPTSAKNSEV